MKHATVRIAGMTIPLIGLDPHATEDKCEWCRNFYHIQRLAWVIRNGSTVLLCATCQTKEKPDA